LLFIEFLDRAAVTDEQQEEYDIFVQQTEELERQLAKTDKTKKVLQDQTAKVLFDKCSSPVNQFYSGTHKQVGTRKKHVGELQALLI
jgi:hypothetical protein